MVVAVPASPLINTPEGYERVNRKKELLKIEDTEEDTHLGCIKIISPVSKLTGKINRHVCHLSVRDVCLTRKSYCKFQPA